MFFLLERKTDEMNDGTEKRGSILVTEINKRIMIRRSDEGVMEC